MQPIGRVVASVIDGATASAAPAARNLEAELLALATATRERNGGMSFASAAYRDAGTAVQELPVGFQTSEKAIARGLDLSVRQVKDAIHALKNELKIGGARHNPDVIVDTSTGPGRGATFELKRGALGEQIGNLLDFVR